MNNDGNVVVITGANNGIGLHMVEPLLQQQYRVAVLDLSGENVETLLAAYQEQLMVLHCDVSKEADVAEAIAAVMNRWGRIDILMNNAAVCEFTPFVERSIEQTRREFEVNYFGYLRMIQAVLPHMKAQGKGRIHNVSSGVGITGFSGISGYSSTKGAIEALSRTLSIELAPYGISVHLMHPPLTHTKSSSPLGIPAQAMAHPQVIGRKFAEKIESAKHVITPDLQTSLYLFFARLFPQSLGKLMSKLADRSRPSRSV